MASYAGIWNRIAIESDRRAVPCQADRSLMIRPLRIAHTSDVHLHNGEDGAHVRTAFTRVVDAVIRTEAELFLIAGDLFDDNRVRKDVIEFVYEQLARVECPTVLIAGNHDCWEDR